MSRITLSRYLIEAQRQNNLPADLRLLIEVVARACKSIAVAVGKRADKDLVKYVATILVIPCSLLKANLGS